MPLAPPKSNSISLAKYHFPTAPADTDTVDPSPAVDADEAALKPEGVRRLFVVGPAERAEVSIGQLLLIGRRRDLRPIGGQRWRRRDLVRYR